MDILIKDIEPDSTITIDSFGYAYTNGKRLESEIDGQPRRCCDRPSIIMEVDHGHEPSLHRIFCEHCNKTTHIHDSYSDALREWDFGLVSRREDELDKRI